MDQHTQKKSSILRFFPFTKGFRGKFLLAFLMVIVAVVANYMTPQVIRVTVDSVINDTPFNLPAFLVEWIESIGGREMLRQHIVICAAVSLVFAVIAGLSNYSSRMSLARACAALTAARVPGPKLPSGEIRRARWRATTAAPFEPRWMTVLT